MARIRVRMIAAAVSCVVVISCPLAHRCAWLVPGGWSQHLLPGGHFGTIARQIGLFVSVAVGPYVGSCGRVVLSRGNRRQRGVGRGRQCGGWRGALCPGGARG